MQNNSITCIITFHKEGLLAHKTLLSIERCRKYAEKYNIEVHFICTLDRADEETTRVVKEHPVIRSTDKIFDIDVGDLGLSRNYGVQHTQTNYISIHDGDDYYGEDLLKKYIDYATVHHNEIILHNSLTFHFDIAHTVEIKNLYLSEKLENIGFYNYFPTHSFGLTKIYKEIPYREKDFKNGFGYEDWLWNLETLDRGYKHYIVPNTYYFYRRKIQNSLYLEAEASGAMLYSIDFFNNFYGKEELEEQKQISFRIFHKLKNNVKKNLNKIQNIIPKTLKHYLLLICFFIRIPIPDRLAVSVIKRKIHKIPKEKFENFNIHILEKTFFLLSRTIPKSILYDMRDIGTRIDFKLFANRFLLRHYIIAGTFNFDEIMQSKVGYVYGQIYSQLKKNHGDIIFFLNDITENNKDFILPFINNILNKNKKIILLKTDVKDSSYIINSTNTIILDITNLLSCISYRNRLMVLSRLIVQLQPSYIHIFDSKIAMDTLSKYNKSILYFSKVYVSILENSNNQNNSFLDDMLFDNYVYYSYIFVLDKLYFNKIAQILGNSISNKIFVLDDIKNNTLLLNKMMEISYCE